MGTSSAAANARALLCSLALLASLQVAAFRVVLRNMDTGRGAVASSKALVGDSKPLVVIKLDIV